MIATGKTVALRPVKHPLGSGLENSLDAVNPDQAVASGLAFESLNHRVGLTTFFEGRDPENR